MRSEAKEFAVLLDRERDAARKADIDTLLSLQEQKRAVMDQLRALSASPDEIDFLAQSAKANIVLIRYLVQCLRGVVEGGDESVYTASGARLSAPAGRHRGSL